MPYYNYDQYLAYFKAEQAVSEFIAIKPSRTPTITFKLPQGQTLTELEHIDLIVEKYGEDVQILNIIDDPTPSNCSLAIPKFNHFLDIPIDLYKTRLHEILKTPHSNPILLTPIELHYLQTGNYDV